MKFDSKAQSSSFLSAFSLVSINHVGVRVACHVHSVFSLPIDREELKIKFITKGGSGERK